VGEANGLAAYWRNLSVVLLGCLCLFIFDMCERGVQLQNPFYSIWVTELGTNLALGFIILAGISAGLYFVFLCYRIRKVNWDFCQWCCVEWIRIGFNTDPDSDPSDGVGC
jgi:hypothetical protein